MGEKHESLVTKYRGRLLRKGYNITRKAPFVDYKPDVCAVKKKEKIFAEIELARTLHSDHTLGQLLTMHEYVRKSKNYVGVLVVPNNAVSHAKLLLASVFGDGKLKVVGL